MKIKRVISLAAFALMAMLAPMAQAQESGPPQTDPNARAHFLSSIKSSGTKATLRVRYRCAEGETVWVAAKQSKSGRKFLALKKEGSRRSRRATCRAIATRSSATAPTTQRRSRSTRSRGAARARLKRGIAAVQLCVTKGESVLDGGGWPPVRPTARSSFAVTTSWHISPYRSCAARRPGRGSRSWCGSSAP